MTEYNEEIKGIFTDFVYDYRNETMNFDDFAERLNEYADGQPSIYTNTCRDFITTNWDEAAETYEWMKDVGFDPVPNPFEDPYLFAGYMVYKGLQDILWGIEALRPARDDHEEIALNDEFISGVETELQTIDL